MGRQLAAPGRRGSLGRKGAVDLRADGAGRTGLMRKRGRLRPPSQQCEPHLEAELLNCSSGRELADAGFSEDVAIAAELDVSTGVPVLADGRFTAARHR